MAPSSHQAQGCPRSAKDTAVHRRPQGADPTAVPCCTQMHSETELLHCWCSQTQTCAVLGGSQLWAFCEKCFLKWNCWRLIVLTATQERLLVWE